MSSAVTDTTWIVIATCLAGCGAGSSEARGTTSCWSGRANVTPCAAPVHPERVGAWRDVGAGEMAFVYDGCTVAFRYIGGRNNDDPVRYYADGALIGVRYTDYGDPPPYYRATAEWDADTLLARSIIAPEMPVARWDGRRFVMVHGPEYAFRRVTQDADLDANLRGLLCVERRTPTEEEVLQSAATPSSD